MLSPTGYTPGCVSTEGKASCEFCSAVSPTTPTVVKFRHACSVEAPIRCSKTDGASWSCSWNALATKVLVEYRTAECAAGSSCSLRREGRDNIGDDNEPTAKKSQMARPNSMVMAMAWAVHCSQLFRRREWGTRASLSSSAVPGMGDLSWYRGKSSRSSVDEGLIFW